MIIPNAGMLPKFKILRRSSRGEYGEGVERYRIRMEKAIVCTLGLFILLFLLSRKMPDHRMHVWSAGSLTAVCFDAVPNTSGGIPRPPTLPEIPIPTDDDFVPEDETIDETILDVDESIPVFDSQGPYGSGMDYSALAPRPIREVIPEYPAQERRLGVGGTVELDILINAHGIVDSVRVVQNTTMSSRLVESAVFAAYRSVYEPVQRDGRAVARWIRRPYTFGK